MNRTLARRSVATLLSLTALAMVAPAVQASDSEHDHGDRHGKHRDHGHQGHWHGKHGKAVVTVMTRNLYLGTDLIRIATAPTLAEFEARATAGFEQVRATDFPARARLIAREIRRTNPDVIGLQEAALWRTGPKDGTATPAMEVEYDYVRILLRALRRIGLDYEVAHSTDEADIEGPTSGDFDVRLTMRDVVLVDDDTKGLDVEGSGGANYATRLPLPTVAGVFTVLRGYAYADLELRGRDFRFVNTHLEAFADPIRVGQAQELVAPGGPLAGDRLIVVGDMNSDPNGAGGSPPTAWLVLTAAGLIDVWPALYPGDPGYECCLRTDSLTDPPSPSPFDHRIDQIFVRGDVRPLNAKIVGTDPARSRTRSGLWASDHGGVVAKLKLK
ncbi:MAG TPA: endonuclease/exonuclease/phosphatase family protein [Thermoleophilaceae bacterium]|nr:endonuclease/exonuclease/phosphatase family protein [Thermoleophilaceae bacterium]